MHGTRQSKIDAKAHGNAQFDNGVLTLTLVKRQAGTGAQRLSID